jgi:translation initiation factor 1 (eIF-1/SUI1)
VKTLHGKELDGPALISLAESYSHAINTGSVPNIGEAWDALCLAQNERKVEAVVAGFKHRTLAALRQLIPCPPTNLRAAFAAEVQEAVAVVRKEGYGDAAALESCAARLMHTLGDLMDGILSENEKVGSEQCSRVLRELYEPVQIKLQENGFRSLLEYDQQRQAVAAAYYQRAPDLPKRHEIMLQFSLEALSAAAQSILSAAAAGAEQASMQLRDTLETERRVAMEQRMGVLKDRDVALARCESLTAALSEAKAREEDAKKRAEQAASDFRQEREELAARLKQAEQVSSLNDQALRAAEAKAVLLEGERDRIVVFCKQHECAVQEQRQQAAAAESRLHKQLDDARSQFDTALSEARAQFRSDVNERDARARELSTQLEQCRAELLTARNEAASQQQAHALLQIEAAAKISAAAAASEQQRLSLRQEFDIAQAAFKAQEAELRDALTREQQLLASARDAVKDAQAQAAAAEAARSALCMALEQHQQQNSSIIEALKFATPAAVPPAAAHPESLLTDIVSCNEATVERVLKSHTEERKQLFAVVQQLQSKCDAMICHQRELEVGAALSVIEGYSDTQLYADSIAKDLAVQEACYGTNSRHIVASLFRLAVCVGLNGDHSAKANLLQRALCIIDANGSVWSLHVACQHHLACAYESLGLMQKSSAAVQRAIQLLEEHSSAHYLMPTLFEIMGRTQHHLGLHNQASASFERAIQLKEQQLGTSDVLLASCLIGLAAAQRSLGNKDDARANCERAYSICEGSLGPQHPHTAFALAQAAYSSFVCGGEACELKLQLQRLENASSIMSMRAQASPGDHRPSSSAASTPASHLFSSPTASTPTLSAASPAPIPIIKGHTAAHTPVAHSPAAPAHSPPSLALDAATVNTLLAQCLCAADGSRTSSMTYADGTAQSLLSAASAPIKNPADVLSRRP